MIDTLLASTTAAADYRRLVVELGLPEVAATALKPFIVAVMEKNIHLGRSDKRTTKKLRTLRTRNKALIAQLACKQLRPEYNCHRVDFHGKGFDSVRSCNRHVKAFVDSLKEKFPDDTFKQMTVAGAVADRLGALEGYLDIGNYKIDADSPITKKQVEVAIACLASWREFNAKLRHIWPKGRYPNDVRAVVHATNAAMGSPAR